MRKFNSTVALRGLALNVCIGTALTAFASPADSLIAVRGLPTLTSATVGLQQDQGGPVRLARFSLIEGSVTWRSSDADEWSNAQMNMPFRQGAQIWLNEGSRAEVQFDDGSTLRLGNSALVTVETLFSDNNGEFTELRLQAGSASLHLRSSASTYQVDTTIGSVKAAGPASVRVGADGNLRVAVHSGQAHVEGPQGAVDLSSGTSIDLADGNSPLSVHGLPSEDDFDQFCSTRDSAMFHHSQYVPSNIALVSGDLDNYGNWVYAPGYGRIWRPSNVDSDWRPYHNGSWVYVAPFGYTWVANDSEPWGWAPYHYGTWVQYGGGWGWVPGPTRQYWSPAVVSFSSYNGQVGWCPLAPAEVHYPPAIAIGFASGNWALHFSIGGAASYYPTSNGYCEARPWDNRTVNRTTIINQTTIINNYNTYNTTNNYNGGGRFHPLNAARGGTITTSGGFGSGGARYVKATPLNSGLFQHILTAPVRSGVAFGPPGVKLTHTAFTPTHTFVHASPPSVLLRQPVYRSAVPTHIAVTSSLPPSQVKRTGAPPRGLNTTTTYPGTKLGKTGSFSGKGSGYSGTGKKAKTPSYPTTGKTGSFGTNRGVPPRATKQPTYTPKLHSGATHPKYETPTYPKTKAMTPTHTPTYATPANHVSTYSRPKMATPTYTAPKPRATTPRVAPKAAPKKATPEKKKDGHP